MPSAGHGNAALYFANAVAKRFKARRAFFGVNAPIKAVLPPSIARIAAAN